MAVGVIVDQAIAQPQHAVKTQIAGQPRLDIGARKPRIAVGVEQALLGGHHQARAVAIERPAFEHPIRRAQFKPGIGGQLGTDRLVAVHHIFPAPAVEAEPPGTPVGHHQRTGVAQPDIAVDAPLQRNPRADQPLRAHRIGPIAHHQPHRLAAVSHGICKARDLFLRARKNSRPLPGVMRKADPQPALRMPFGGHEGAGLFHGRANWQSSPPRARPRRLIAVARAGIAGG